MDLERSSRNVGPEGITFTLAGLTDEERALAVGVAVTASDVMDTLRDSYRAAGGVVAADHLEGLRIDYSDLAEAVRHDESPTFTSREFSLLRRALDLPSQLRSVTSPPGEHCDELGIRAVEARQFYRTLGRLMTSYDEQQQR